MGADLGWDVAAFAGLAGSSLGLFVFASQRTAGLRFSLFLLDQNYGPPTHRYGPRAFHHGLFQSLASLSIRWSVHVALQSPWPFMCPYRARGRSCGLTEAMAIPPSPTPFRLFHTTGFGHFGCIFINSCIAPLAFQVLSATCTFPSLVRSSLGLFVFASQRTADVQAALRRPSDSARKVHSPSSIRIVRTAAKPPVNIADLWAQLAAVMQLWIAAAGSLRVETAIALIYDYGMDAGTVLKADQEFAHSVLAAAQQEDARRYQPFRDHFTLTCLMSTANPALADKMEALYIAQYKCQGPDGYNVLHGPPSASQHRGGPRRRRPSHACQADTATGHLTDGVRRFPR
ncbi:hypothetical protein VOLCADRAFT_89125 [Volvox carteri f. nagariensis]|uniref:Uncharacterized protein n=1 Tax=Volvox carteri f. nagariensis TaxID=3068 RepID=D8TQV3_VOLCA|nr:uncharacterized protein VOLCADRAFT_89125 [Volvox carteri f. nagariensis]EFJ50219.1 hypothetical protein VOLCADRAFT_89125 [Volvox carteri f. nagariensis]|eukprot:XP_002948839.1 hypothetical protein VOLCADRAFT_89125 [Volvox carteri f. nagariensis]